MNAQASGVWSAVAGKFNLCTRSSTMNAPPRSPQTSLDDDTGPPDGAAGLDAEL